VFATKGGSSGKGARTSSNTAATTTTTPTTGKHHSHSTKAAAHQPKAAPPGETSVVVLNGTETTGLATRIAAQLQQGGYNQAAARYGRPPGANEVTVVEYAPGHQADATQLARSLSVTHVEPVEQGVAALAGAGTSVVVVVGADKANSTP
jgi:hypothetical protein